MKCDAISLIWDWNVIEETIREEIVCDKCLWEHNYWDETSREAMFLYSIVKAMIWYKMTPLSLNNSVRPTYIYKLYIPI